MKFTRVGGNRRVLLHKRCIFMLSIDSPRAIYGRVTQAICGRDNSILSTNGRRLATVAVVLNKACIELGEPADQLISAILKHLHSILKQSLAMFERLQLGHELRVNHGATCAERGQNRVELSLRGGAQ